MSELPLIMPISHMKTRCPVIDRDYLPRAKEEGFDPIYKAVFGLARKYKTHVIYIRETERGTVGVDDTLCSEEDKWVDDAVGSIVREVNEAIMRRKSCEENVWRNAQSMEPDTVAKALKGCVNELVNTLSKFDEDVARAIGDAYMRSIPLMVSRALKTRKSDKIDRLVGEISRDTRPLYVKLFEKAFMKTFSSHTVISIYITETYKAMIVVEDGGARVIQLGPMNSVDETREEYKKLATYYPDVFSVGCGDCPHVGLARLVWAVRKDKDYPLFAKLVVWYLLNDEPPEVREVVAKVMGESPELLLSLISLAHSIETGYFTTIYLGNTPACTSILTFPVTKDILNEFISLIKDAYETMNKPESTQQ